MHERTAGRFEHPRREEAVWARTAKLTHRTRTRECARRGYGTQNGLTTDVLGRHLYSLSSQSATEQGLTMRQPWNCISPERRFCCTCEIDFTHYLRETIVYDIVKKFSSQ